MTSSILILCVGNICRSPMGEFLLRGMMEKDGHEMKISSAGIGALVGHGPDQNALDVMKEHGIDMAGHQARQVNEEMVKQNDLILVMEHWQQKEIENLYPFSRGRVHLLGKWSNIEVEDPYRRSKEHFVTAFELIAQSCQQWHEKLH